MDAAHVAATLRTQDWCVLADALPVSLRDALAADPADAADAAETIVVTGACGFVGQALVARLAARGERIVALDRDIAGMDRIAGVRGVAGDLADPATRHAALSDGCAAVVHLATVPGGAAEADPAASRRVNIDAMYDFMIEAAAVASAAPRFVYASSIAVFGDPLPASGVDDQTPLAPRLIYGGHKAMMETAVCMMTQRGDIDGVTLRLPGILARPAGAAGMKSAFMSDVFHALRSGREFVCPVSPEATIWAESIGCITDNLDHALNVGGDMLPLGRAVTLPALRIAMVDLIEEIARQCDVSTQLVRYAPDAALEAAFGAHPPLSTPAAERAGFRSDGTVAALVADALARLAPRAI